MDQLKHFIKDTHSKNYAGSQYPLDYPEQNKPLTTPTEYTKMWNPAKKDKTSNNNIITKAREGFETAWQTNTQQDEKARQLATKYKSMPLQQGVEERKDLHPLMRRKVVKQQYMNDWLSENRRL